MFRFGLVFILLLSLILLQSCGTAYYADYSRPSTPDERTNPYTKSVPNDGVSSAIRDALNNNNRRY